ncbi:hypothetical protein TNIN_276251 [Trichonephila inaurata madagascariensis]|uniref:Uncharacterized protein n=1 Tax=Trichonephila inaurata madagascariensis TaxID=2747483 RepID=A0A8X6XMT4_9ARAC|nr:hypothetical protein TNIN_276251 [Trichonephila inaurata madagascariensis]
MSLTDSKSTMTSLRNAIPNLFLVALNGLKAPKGEGRKVTETFIAKQKIGSLVPSYPSAKKTRLHGRVARIRKHIIVTCLT